MVVSFSEYKGFKLIVLKRNEADRFPLQFGKSKAKLIADNIELLKTFADEKDVDPNLIDEFKGHKLVILKRNEADRYPMKLGLSKVKLIVENLDEIIKFANE